MKQIIIKYNKDLFQNLIIMIANIKVKLYKLDNK